MLNICNRFSFILIALMLISHALQAQTNDDIVLQSKPDTIKPATPKPLFNTEAKYNSTDSIIYSLDGQRVFLYGNASVSYESIQLTAHHIEIDLSKGEAYAVGTVDSTKKEVGLPVFKDESGSYTMRKMRYNFNTEKAIIEHVVTEQGEGYIVSDIAKKSADNVFCLKGGKYSTCDQHDHPHFYLQMTKAKVIPGKKIITGPAYLVMEDIPFPIGIPFGFVPSTSKYSSGFLFPSYGEESNRGFFLRNGGYYWAANDYFDFEVTGDIYSNGSWGLRSGSDYNKRYKFSGGFNFQLITNIFSEKDLPDYSKSKDFSLTWSHRQDAKANPYQSFSASVNYSTSSFDRNNVGSIINPMELAQNTKRSSISYSKRWAGNNPFNVSANFLHSQNSRDSTIDLTIPDLTLTMNRIFPFKRKNRVGSNEGWYEKISLSYSANAKNYIHTKESELLPIDLNKDWKNGIKHNIPVSMSLKFLKYFTASPSINYTERWYFESIEKDYDATQNRVVVTDTIRGFNRVYDYSYSVGTSTKVYAFFTPWKKLFGDKINTIRHVMTPSVSLSYRPDFADPKFGFFDTVEYFDPKLKETVNHQYSRYEGSVFGSPSSGKSGSMGFNLGNSLEMKVKSQKDSTGFSKIKILESLNFSSSYNMLADSLNWSRISMNGRTKLFKTDINFNAIFDPYALDTNKLGAPIRINQSMWNAQKKVARIESASMSFGFSLDNQTFKKKDAQTSGNDDNTSIPPNGKGFPEGDDNINPNDEQPNTALQAGTDGYAKFNIPWNVSFNYNMRLTPGQFDKRAMAFKQKISADVTFSGSIKPTPKWDISFSSGYSLDTKDLAHTNLNFRRNLHCWSMSFNLVPIGRYKSYFFSIAANSSMLKDLKYEKRNHPRDNQGFY
jgi:lipopolysaccharide assembly outer membrane protein LptD (OstA)